MEMTKAKTHFITGGQRSGKSEYAESLALTKSDTPTYLATSKCWDEEFSKRIETHKERRKEGWITIEEEINIGTINLPKQVVLLDCITLWLTNVMDANQYDFEKSLEFALQEWDRLIAKKEELIVVSNEIVMGVIPMEKMTRQFVDLQGKVNQYIAKKADKVTLMVSGIPVPVKG
jgi:adenosylcobinamide kinase/adenosylcobinamide-phosphate guanylyltransferase